MKRRTDSKDKKPEPKRTDRLKVKREVLRNLDPKELFEVVGGGVCGASRNPP